MATLMNVLGTLHESHVVRKVLGVKQDALTQWLIRSQVFADLPADGSGTRNQFRISTICQIALFKDLNAAKFSRAEASRLAFNNKVKGFFELIISDEKVNNALREDYGERPPIVNVAFIERGDDIKVEYISSEKGYLRLYRQIKRSRQVHISNLTWIAFDVLERLKDLL